MMRNNILVFIFALGWNLLPAQSASLNLVAEDMPALKKHYVYPSIIRALASVSNDNSMQNLIEDLDYVRILRIDSSLIAEEGERFKVLGKALKEEGYESMATYSNKGSEFSILVHPYSEGLADFILLQRGEHSQLYIEFVGELDAGSLQDLLGMDLEIFEMFME